jgi:hypothetical protein
MRGLKAYYKAVSGLHSPYAGENKLTMNGEFLFLSNKFVGNQFSLVGLNIYRRYLGKNITWRF